LDCVFCEWSAASAAIISEAIANGHQQRVIRELIGVFVILGLHVTGFAASAAVILAIFA